MTSRLLSQAFRNCYPLSFGATHTDHKVHQFLSATLLGDCAHSVSIQTGQIFRRRKQGINLPSPTHPDHQQLSSLSGDSTNQFGYQYSLESHKIQYTGVQSMEHDLHSQIKKKTVKCLDTPHSLVSVCMHLIDHFCKSVATN